MAKPDKVDYDRISNLPENSITCIMRFEGKEYSRGFLITKDREKDRRLLKWLWRAGEITLDIRVFGLMKELRKQADEWELRHDAS